MSTNTAVLKSSSVARNMYQFHCHFKRSPFKTLDPASPAKEQQIGKKKRCITSTRPPYGGNWTLWLPPWEGPLLHWYSTPQAAFPGWPAIRGQAGMCWNGWSFAGFRYPLSCEHFGDSLFKLYFLNIEVETFTVFSYTDSSNKSYI